jgi:protein arginine kinase
MSHGFPANTDDWLLENAPLNSVVISSRARLARNFPRIPFAPRANHDQLRFIAQMARDGFGRNKALRNYSVIELTSIPTQRRSFLRESHLISSELEKGGVGRMVCLSPGMDTSIMVNEEDHLRLSTLMSGLRIEEVYARLAEIEKEVEGELELAYSEEFGYLTACPTNTGTGLRLSVMLHLTALVMIGQAEEALSTLGNYGLVVRGAYGEHSEHSGDMFQISNEVTLGKSEEQILEIHKKVVGQVIQTELQAREALFRQARDKIEDAVCRATGLLATARRIDSSEAVSLLSRTRLGIGRNWGVQLSHSELSRLFVDIQPSHIQCLEQGDSTPEDRDTIRASLLRSKFGFENGKARDN